MLWLIERVVAYYLHLQAIGFGGMHPASYWSMRFMASILPRNQGTVNSLV